MKPRKLEYFEDQLKESPLGREVLHIMRTHSKEVLYLVQKNRATMVCWQRHQGPAFIKSFVDSGFEEDTQFVREVKGIRLESLILHMAEVLQDNGTPPLKAAVGKYVATVLTIAQQTHSLREIIHRINTTPIPQHYA